MVRRISQTPIWTATTTGMEWRADTVPTNALSRLTLVYAHKHSDWHDCTWQSVPTRSYFLERGTNVNRAITNLAPVATGLPGQSGTTTFTDTAATNGGPFFYRVGVQYMRRFV